jgi:hypothetical protein
MERRMRGGDTGVRVWGRENLDKENNDPNRARVDRRGNTGTGMRLGIGMRNTPSHSGWTIR